MKKNAPLRLEYWLIDLPMNRGMPKDPCNKAEIPGQIRAGGIQENEAIACLMKLSWEKVIKFVRSKGGSLQDGEDIFMEAISTVVIHVKSGRYREDANIETYLISVARNMWLNRLRKVKREVSLNTNQEEGGVEISTNIQFLTDPENRDKVSHIKKFLENVLGENCKKIILLDMEKYRTKEMVNILEDYNNPASIDNKRAQCRKKLKRALKEQSGIRIWFRELSEN